MCMGGGGGRDHDALSTAELFVKRPNLEDFSVACFAVRDAYLRA